MVGFEFAQRGFQLLAGAYRVALGGFAGQNKFVTAALYRLADHFLVFAVAMLFEIEATLMLTGTLLAFFLLLPSTNLTDLAHLGELLAFVMITPLSLYISHQHEDIAKQRAKTHALTNHLAQEETDTLLFLSTNLKTTLLSALDSLSIIIPKTTAKKAKSDLSVLYSDLRALYRSAQDLQNSIDLETD